MGKRLFFVYRILTIVSLSSGIILNLVNTTTPSILICYYTMQSNILCLAGFIFFTLKKKRNINKYHICKGAITIAILVTAVVYLICLLPNNYPMYKVSEEITDKAIGNLLVHVISPMLVILDYFIWDEKGKLKLYYPWVWLIIPCIYVGFVYVFHTIGGHFYSIGGSREFAYFFLDYKQIGIEGVIIWILKIAIFIVGMGYALIAIDKILGTHKKKKSTS